jgi:hypothetical protein
MSLTEAIDTRGQVLVLTSDSRLEAGCNCSSGHVRITAKESEFQ